MPAIEAFSQALVDLVWGLPVVILIAAASIYFAFISRLIPFKGVSHSIELLSGKYDDPDAPGEISHFQALSSALSGTVGMGNIAGVAIAISVGGPGAVFWMWMAGTLGMVTKFFTCTLACMYRQKDASGVAHGGPMYFIEYGMGKKFKPLAMMFAFCGMFGTLPMFQSNQLAGLLQAEWGITPGLTGIITALLVAIVIVGGIKRIGRIASGLVPTMSILYLVSSLIVIFSNYEVVPIVFLDIFRAAFGFDPVVGGAVGLTFKEVLVTGVRRAVFSNEAGVGTEALAHGAARTKEPVREGLVAMVGPFIDTHIICTLTALVILSSGVAPESSGIVMTSNAFTQAMPAFGGSLLSFIVALFAVSTMITLSYYGLKCARYLLGHRIGGYYLYIYLLLIPIAAIWSQNTILNIMDSAFGLMVIPTLSATLYLAPKVVEEMKSYFSRAGITQ